MSKRRKETNSAKEILHQRYVGDDPERKASIETERVNVAVARMIHDRRTSVGMSQKELAKLIDTTQSVISRLEDADYEGHSLSMLNRIAEALDQRVTVEMTARAPEPDDIRHAFHLFVCMLRRAWGLSVDALAKQADIDRTEIVAMEQHTGYKPSPLTLHRLSNFFKIPQQNLQILAGATRPSERFREEASQFAAKSESFAKLTKEEKKILDQFVSFLRAKGTDH